MDLSGKTAPTFVEDLALHDPLHPPPSGFNLLTEPCLGLVFTAQLGHLLHPETCRHAFSTKDRQSLLPALDERPGPNSVYKVSAVCKYCRLHVQVKVDYTVRWEDKPCPNEDNPVHHLVPAPWQEQLARNKWSSKNPQSPDIINVFECSSKTCSAAVTVQVAPPILSPNAIHTLVDKNLLKGRTDEAFRTRAGQVEGMKYPTPMDVLLDLRQYLRNAQRKENRPISVENKRFMVRFGPEGAACRDVLESLKFTYKVCCVLQKFTREGSN
jgi:ubiquitin carboxyl-terminal hydrolase 25/28